MTFAIATATLSLTGFAITLPFSSKAVCADTVNVETIWTSAKFIEGRGVTNCGSARIDNDVRSSCQNLVETNSQVLKLLEYTWYNAESEYTEGPWYDQKRSCVYRATYKCKILVSKESF